MGEFSRKFSDEHIGKDSPCGFYFASNEYNIKDPVAWISAHSKGKPLYLMGIIGGGDTALSYVSALQPQRAFFFDISDKAVSYLGLRLSLMKDAKNVSEYLLDMLCVRPEHRNDFFNVSGDAALRQRIRSYTSDYVGIAMQGLGFMKGHGFDTSDVNSEVFYDPNFRKRAAVECVRYMQHIQENGEKEHSWIDTNNYESLRRSVQENRIKAFRSDYFGGFKTSAQTLIQLYDIRNLVVYLSNFTDICQRAPTKDQQFDNCQKVKAVLDPLSELVDKMWVIDSRKVDGTNRIVYGK